MSGPVTPREISDGGGGMRVTATATDQVKAAARRDRREREAAGPGGALPTGNGKPFTERIDGPPG